MTNTAELEGAIAKSGKSKKEIAAALALSEAGLWKKITNQSEFKATEIKKIQSLLSLSAAERDLIFLHNRVILNHINFFSPLSRPQITSCYCYIHRELCYARQQLPWAAQRREEQKKSEVIKFESFRRASVGYRSQLSTAGRRSGFLRIQVGEVDYEFIERTGGINMIDRLIIYLWLFMSVVLIIAAAEKMSCVRF